ncbi:hypothetical protein [Allobranchiibius sp. GilTou38]|uniref:hypothetical protein n=1 Tax=Allobranchiibius sp. GilTou38 TaxID=2815210 RepID=UPI001AA18E2C|nr:hypothetical protein [Allobranchiibius sp. GilTou38]MBO1765853.1 hypothetical protein [Allobranchiibius sp. GilTou38]
MTALLAPRAVARARADWRILADRRLVPLVVLGYLVCRAFSAVLMIWLARHQPPAGVPGGVSGGHATYWDETRMWDGRWYQEIAAHGYPHHLPVGQDGKVAQNAWAFLPLYPLAVKCLMLVTGASFAVAGSLLSLVLGGAAVAVMAVLLRDRIGAPAAIASAVVFSALPPAIALQMTYTESLALLVLMGFLLALEREQWVVAAVLALTMGLTRPIAAPMVLVVLAVAVSRWRERRIRPVRGSDWVGMSAVAAAGVVGALLWAQIAGRVTGVRSAYFDTQGAWRADGVVFFVPWVRNFELLFGQVGAVIVLVALLATFVVMVTGPWARALGPVLLGWTVAYAAYLVATVDVWTSTYRYAMFLFPLVPVTLGVGWVRRERRVLVPLRCAVFLLLSLGWQVWWAWTLLRFVPPVGNPI